MNDEREDFELAGGAESEVKGTGEPWVEERRARGPWLWIVLAVVVAVGVGLWFYLRPAPAPEAVAPPPAPAAPAEPEAAEPVPEEVAVPPLEETDPWLREVVQQLSGHPALTQWLATDDLVQRFVVLVDNVADGVSPAQQVPFVRPKQAYAVRTSGDGTYVDPASYQRFATLAAVVDSLHVEGTADLYRRLKPRLEEAYAQLGYPDRTFEGTLEKAIRRVLSAPRLDGPVALEESTEGYRYADPRLEGLDPATKDLLRLGPDHLATIQRKLRALARAAGLDVAGA